MSWYYCQRVSYKCQKWYRRSWQVACTPKRKTAENGRAMWLGFIDVFNRPEMKNRQHTQQGDWFRFKGQQCSWALCDEAGVCCCFVSGFSSETKKSSTWLFFVSGHGRVKNVCPDILPMWMAPTKSFLRRTRCLSQLPLSCLSFHLLTVALRTIHNAAYWIVSLHVLSVQCRLPHTHFCGMCRACSRCKCKSYKRCKWQQSELI